MATTAEPSGATSGSVIDHRQVDAKELSAHQRFLARAERLRATFKADMKNINSKENMDKIFLLSPQSCRLIEAIDAAEYGTRYQEQPRTEKTIVRYTWPDEPESDALKTTLPSQPPHPAATVATKK